MNLPYQFENHIMSKFLIIVALLLLVIWAVGFFVYDLGIAIHLFLLLAAVSMIIKVLQEK
jgi:hypothetical protein